MARKLKREKYRFGNYDKYYNDRNIDRWIDPRMQVFEKSWFEGKSIIDIGSNDGTLTILIACNFSPLSITGVELDHRLINRAVENSVYIEKIRKQLIENKEQIEALSEFQNFPISFKQYLKLPNHIQSLQPLIALKDHLQSSGNFPSNISFKNANILNTELAGDVFLCLSTIKWIHLNWGDSGVKDLFHSVYRNLPNEGLFIFEPQDWKSYKKAKIKSPTLSRNFSQIVFKPEEFSGYLENLGFVCVKILTPYGQKENFNREIFVYRKEVDKHSNLF